jgi:hypothetical protein
LTLVELMIAVTISLLALSAVMMLLLYSARAFAAITNYVDLDQYSRKTLDRMSLEVRQADKLTICTSTQLVFNLNGGSNNLSYTYNPALRTLVRTNGANSETMLRECTALTFSIFGRNNMSNTFDQFPTAVATNAKLIRVSWTCVRTILGSAINTESLQSAKIVIRQQ